MMHFPGRLAVAAILAIVSAPGAMAADLESVPSIGQVPEIVPVRANSGWYIRGDIGYPALTNSPNFSYRSYDIGTGTYDSTAYDSSSSIKADFSGDVGIGYQFNQFFRMDATLGRMSGSFSGSSRRGSPCVDPQIDFAYAGTSCSTKDGADFTGWSTLLNAYFEPGTFVGITPYVGAGAGVTRLGWGSLESVDTCRDGSGTCPAARSSESRPGEADWRFTWALMAGLAYDITPRLKLDVGYRYSRIAGGGMYGWGSDAAHNGASGAAASDRGLSTHEVRIGVRYTFW